MNIRTLFASLALVALLLAPTAAAHKTTYSDDGKIKIVWGFRNEPATTWTKTDLDLILTDNVTGAPITGATETIQHAALEYGEEELDLELEAQHGQVGRYTSQVVTLTRPGYYTLHLEGTINDANPYEAATEIAALKARLDALEAKADTQSSTPATVTAQTPTSQTPGFTFVALLGAVAVLLALRRK